MNIICLHFTQVDLLEQEKLIGQLSMLTDIEGFEQFDNELKAYLSESDFDELTLRQTVTEKFHSTILPKQNWNAVWESNFEPVLVNDFCGVRAHFHPPFTHVQNEIIITPKMSFGTGHHATTYQVIEAMSLINFSNKTVCDYGTGTGVLAILAEKLGAVAITAIDNDDWSIENTKENLIVNSSKAIELIKAETIDHKNYDIIVANINKNVLLAQMEKLFEATNTKGVIVISGILKTDQEEMESKIMEFQPKSIKVTEKNHWLCIIINK